MNRRTFNQYISEADFRNLFVSEMGWNNPTGATSLPDYSIDEQTLEITQIADRNGFQILHCEVDRIPTSSFCKKLDTRLRRQANDYILIFSTPKTLHHLWVVPVKKVEKRDLVMVDYDSVERAEFLFQKVEGLTFDLDEKTTISDVIGRVQEAFIINSEKITKDFYSGFKKEHTHFAEFITGIDDQIPEKDNRNKQWYTSVMLNRLMFCYFIQKKGFLDGDVDYLKHKLEWTKRERGDNRFFHSFYKGFLVTLFHGGLNAPKHDDKFEDIYGRIPYLNGGMFDEHQIEQDYANLDIADEAFESLFGFFDKWNWHLDDRITATGKDINPDVLGYIFEQYINDRAQMGAYYTKEDITEYIGRNTIVPYLVEQTLKVQKSSSLKDFWGFLQQSSDRYIFDAVKKGVELPLPDYIEQGVDTTKPNLLERRSRWNERTQEEYALPTEIWRETVERRQRYADVKGKIDRGEITSINDFITYNLDIRQFVNDYLLHTDDHLFVKHFYAALQHVTILDPTCGSGAFLFAALNILEPLYEVCISRMQEYAEQNNKLFKEELAEIEHRYRSNIQYFIYKSIILRNLYGVDIMVEATEIAKLRLFLKMVAVVDVNPRDLNLGLDPLPDIDFNIRCGNSLVGYATEEELEQDLCFAKDILEELSNQELKDKLHTEMDKVAFTFKRFKEIQLTQDGNLVSFKAAKKELRDRLGTLNSLLNEKLYISSNDNSLIPIESWLQSYQPFHWLAEFYEIIHDKGGFDVIIGNPPYVEYSKRNVKYTIGTYETIKCSNLYAFVFERSCRISMNAAMIVQLSAVGTDSMKSLQGFLLKEYNSIHFGCFPERPKQLFEGACIALSIIIGRKTKEKTLRGCGVCRTSDEGRKYLFNSLNYTDISNNDFLRGYQLFPKFKSSIENGIASKIFKDTPIGKYVSLTPTRDSLSYRTAGGRYWKIVLNRQFKTQSTSNKTKYINDDISSFSLVSILNSNLMWWYYVIYFDLYNFKDYMIFNFPYSSENEVSKLLELGKELMCSYERNKVENKQFIKSRQVETIFESFNPKFSKPIIDKIDKVLAKHYGFTEEELDFIINYDIKYRMGDELNED